MDYSTMIANKISSIEDRRTIQQKEDDDLKEAQREKLFKKRIRMRFFNFIRNLFNCSKKNEQNYTTRK